MDINNVIFIDKIMFEDKIKDLPSFHIIAIISIINIFLCFNIFFSSFILSLLTLFEMKPLPKISFHLWILTSINRSCLGRLHGYYYIKINLFCLFEVH
jgi:hypothetical protein